MSPVWSLAVSRSGSDVYGEAGENFYTDTIFSCDKQLRLVPYLTRGCLLIPQGWVWLYKPCTTHSQCCSMVRLLCPTQHRARVTQGSASHDPLGVSSQPYIHAGLINRTGSQLQLHTAWQQLGLEDCSGFLLHLPFTKEAQLPIRFLHVFSLTEAFSAPCFPSS